MNTDKLLEHLSADIKEPESHKVRPIDLNPGMFVFVSEWLDEAGAPATETVQSIFGPEERQRKRKPVGDPLKILAVALPYVTVEVIQHKQRGVMDTRLCSFIKVGLSYVRSLVPEYGKKARKLTKAEQIAQEFTTRNVLVAGEGVWKTIQTPKERP